MAMPPLLTVLLHRSDRNYVTLCIYNDIIMNDHCLLFYFTAELDLVLGFLPGFESKCMADVTKKGKLVKYEKTSKRTM